MNHAFGRRAAGAAVPPAAAGALPGTDRESDVTSAGPGAEPTGHTRGALVPGR